MTKFCQLCGHQIDTPLDVDLDFQSYVAKRKGYDDSVYLSRNRAMVLRELLTAPGHVAERQLICNMLYGDREPEDWPTNKRTLDVMISHMRKELRVLGLNIMCVRGRGWFLTASA